MFRYTLMVVVAARDKKFGLLLDVRSRVTVRCVTLRTLLAQGTLTLREKFFTRRIPLNSHSFRASRCRR